MLSKKTKYALNALVYLSKEAKSSQEPVLISQIAQSEKIPQKFLESILLDMKKAGIVNSKRGKGGGYFLQKRPENITLAEIMRLFDGPIALLPCVTYLYYERCEECKDEETCGIRDVFLEMRNITVDLLKKSSIQTMLDRESKLKSKK
ncbi:MAG: Rrf2 family transcriptional regulator [Chitinophagaceae bacterium]|nr:MAG: Rrf2 family transcriptional regulator [Chitinophagaceae bacterium]